VTCGSAISSPMPAMKAAADGQGRVADRSRGGGQ
jgi:hypothetical protein